MRKRKKAKRPRHQQIAVLTFFMGILILLYPSTATRINRMRQTQVVDGYISRVKSLSEAEAKAEIMDLHQYVLDKYGYEMQYFRCPCGEYSEAALVILLV